MFWKNSPEFEKCQENKRFSRQLKYAEIVEREE
jgi:hypothetical protein